jgi:5,10-methenyltetrahydrofolate synthetase
LNEGVWGIREPKDDAPEVDPDILIVPLAAFDRRGNRIGYGAGYYDMTINRLRLAEACRRRRHRLCGAGGSRRCRPRPATPGSILC